MLIDTHKAIKDLTETGVPEKHAEMIVTVVTRANEQVATKEDLKELEVALRKDMEAMETGLREDMEAMETGLRKDMKAQKKEMLKAIETQGIEMKAQEERLKKHTLRAVLIGVGLNFTVVSIGVAIILGILT